MEKTSKIEKTAKTQQEVWNDIAEEWNEFKNHIDPRVEGFVKESSGRLLDLGCGSGRNFTKTKAEVYGVDFSKKMLNHAQNKAKKLNIKNKAILSDVTKTLPFKDDFFDNAICIGTLHCIKGKESRKKVLKEIYRVLKSKGKLLIKVWNKKNIKFIKKPKEKFINWRDKGARYYYFYEAYELERELRSVGFKIILLESVDITTRFEKQEVFALVEKS